MIESLVYFLIGLRYWHDITSKKFMVLYYFFWLDFSNHVILDCDPKLTSTEPADPCDLWLFFSHQPLEHSK